MIPGRPISGIVIALSASALLSTLTVGWRIWRERSGRAPLMRSLLLLLGSLIVYGLELWNGIALVRKPNDDGPVLFIVYLLFAAYGISLARAWELLGARRKGLLTGLLRISDPADNDARTRDDAPVPPRSEESGR